MKLINNLLHYMQDEDHGSKRACPSIGVIKKFI